MTSTDLVNRALGLIDLPNTQAITYQDKYNSLNESFTDIYNQMIQSNDDYFLDEVEISVTSAMAGTGPYEFLVPLPTNFFQLRYCDWLGPQGWTTMSKFNYNQKDDLLIEPKYRIKNNTLWIIVGTPSQTTVPFTIKVGYYPPPMNITLPDLPIQYGLSYTLSQFTQIQLDSPFYFHQDGIQGGTDYDAMFYADSTNKIVVEVSQNANAQTPITPVTLWIDPYTIVGTYYYKGKLYWANSGGGIWYAPVDITNPTLISSATQLVGTGANVLFLHIFNNTVYYGTNNLTWQISTSGAGDTKYLGFPTQVVQIFPNGNVYFVGSGDTLVANTVGGPTILLNNVLDIANDGTNLYVLNSPRTLSVYTPPSFGVLGTGTVITTGVSLEIGAVSNNHITVLHEEQQSLLALSTSPDFDFSSYNNIVLDIIKWRLAMDFGIKFGRIDLAAFQARIAELWTKFRNMVRRDEYKVERIQNMYKGFEAGIYS